MYVAFPRESGRPAQMNGGRKSNTEHTDGQTRRVRTDLVSTEDFLDKSIVNYKLAYSLCLNWVKPRQNYGSARARTGNLQRTQENVNHRGRNLLFES